MDALLGEIRAFAFALTPRGWAPCDGSLLPILKNNALYEVLGTTFGGNGRDTFGLPDLRGRAAVAAGQGQGLSAYKLGTKAGQERVALTLEQIEGHTHSPTGTVRVSAKPGGVSSPAGAYLAASTSSQYGEKGSDEMGTASVKGVGDTVGNNEGHENRQPFLTLNYAIALTGTRRIVEEAYIGEIRLYAGQTPPEGWLFCDGRLLSMNEYSLLASLIGTTYGGDGNTTFALPNMPSRVAVGQGHGPGLTSYNLGQQLGTETMTLQPTETPQHQHPITGKVQVITGATSPTANPAGAYFADKGGPAYNAAAGEGTLAAAAMNGTMNSAGGSGPKSQALPHANVQPVMAINYIICTEGLYPPRG